jgi:hypothetical protein
MPRKTKKRNNFFKMMTLHPQTINQLQYNLFMSRFGKRTTQKRLKNLKLKNKKKRWSKKLKNSKSKHNYLNKNQKN